MDFFAQAVQTEQPKTSKEKVKTIVAVSTNGKIKELIKVREDLEELKAQEALLVDDLKPIAEKTFLKQFKSVGSRPESFVMQDTDGGKVLLIVQDKYSKLTAGIEETLKEVYKKKADDLIGSETTFKFNPDILNEYGPVITKALSAAIQKMDIPAEAKAKLLVADTTKSIKKGTIERLMTFSNPENLFSLIKPTIQFKNQK